MRALLNSLFNTQKLVRRLALAWACWLITVVVLRVTEPEAMHQITTQVVALVTLVVGVLATIIAFYQWGRSKDDSYSSNT